MLTPEIICQRLRRAGLYNPSEVSAADITAGALVAMHGPPAAVVGSSELHRMYTWIKAVGSPAKLEKVAVTGSRPCPCVCDMSERSRDNDRDREGCRGNDRDRDFNACVLPSRNPSGPHQAVEQDHLGSRLCGSPPCLTAGSSQVPSRSRKHAVRCRKPTSALAVESDARCAGPCHDGAAGRQLAAENFLDTSRDGCADELVCTHVARTLQVCAGSFQRIISSVER